MINIMDNNKMRKKHDKVVLKSDVFKNKTPQKTLNMTSRSPISKSPYLSKKQQDKIDPNQLFQKVCCPNCRFIFKVIKGNDSVFTINTIKKDRMINTMMQTDELEIKNLSNQIVKQLTPKTDSLFTKQNTFKFEKNKFTQQPSQSSFIDQSSQRIQDLPFTSKLNISKSSVKNSMRVSQKKSDNSSKFLDPGKSNIGVKRVDAKQVAEMQAFYSKKNDIGQVIQQLYYNKSEKDQLLSICNELPTSIQLPGYQKMLLYQIVNQVNINTA